ncbi:MAG: thioredoxin-like domain-containing protein [Pseudomonadota bacterium]
MSATSSRAPEFPAGLEWFNVKDPVKLADQAGRVVLINFGAFSSINCQHVLQDLNALHRRFRNELAIISVYSPKFTAEKKRSHVQKTINRLDINHPVVHDPDLKLWQMYGTKCWPTQVLLDTEGNILGAMTGDGKKSQLELIIKYQLGRSSEQAGARNISFSARSAPEAPNVLSFPGRMVTTPNKIYIADSGHNRILVVSPGGQVVRQYGSEGAGFIDGNGSAAAFDNPQGMVLADDFLYVADAGNHAIRRIHTRSNDVVTIAGTGSAGTAAAVDIPGTPLTVSMSSPTDVVFKNGKLYIAMAGSHQIWRLSLIANTIEVFCGSGYEDLQDGPPGSAAFSQPSGLTLLQNRLYCVDAGASAVREIDMDTGVVNTLVGEGLFEFGDSDGAGSVARLQYPLDIVADPIHNMLWVTDTFNNKIKRIGVSTNYVSSTSCARRLDEPGGLAFHDDTLYIANTNAHEILCLNPNNGHVEVLNVSEELVEI